MGKPEPNRLISRYYTQKRKKLLRDETVFDKGHVYKWSRKGNKRFSLKQPSQMTEQRDFNTSSDLLFLDLSNMDTDSGGKKEPTSDRDKPTRRDRLNRMSI